MKKSLFFALFACVALAFVSCNPGEDPNAVTGITVTPAEISLVPGDEARLSVAATPAGATFSADSVVWVSSDTNVVVVNSKGGITAVGYGKANVTATYGELSAVCAVWVKTYYESLSFTNAIIWDMDTTYFGGEVYDVESADGQTFKCYLAMAELMICSDGFIVNNEGYLDGGTLATYITMYAPMYFGTKYLNPEAGGVQFSLREWGLAELPADSVKAHIGAPGKVNEEVYLTYMNAALQSLNQGDAQMFQMYMMLAGGYEYQDLPIAISGTTMTTMEYDVDPETNEGGYYSTPIPDGIITKGYFSLNAEGASQFMMGMDFNYFEFQEIPYNEEYLWGCNWIENEDGTLAWGEQNPVLHWGDKVIYQLGEIPTEEAQAKMEPTFAPVMKLDYPEVAERVENQLQQYNTLVKK
jgi:hypothetical protein